MEQFLANPFQPGVSQAQFNPDQLVSGPLQVVTETIMVAKGGVYQRGTILGKITETREYTLSQKDAIDGSQTPSAILIDDVNATNESVSAGAYLMGEFNHHRTIYDPNWTVTELIDALRPFSIFLRDSVQA